ncbi:MAG: arginase family protein [Lachnospiraceae bacterium]|nr:arginase family protein [Lachnospiraceae bacterium]
MKNRLFNFTNTYETSKYKDFSVIECADISGTDMYLDDEAHKKISLLIKDSSPSSPASGIHLIDSGNYHYMSRVFTELIDEPYELIFFDNHTDMKPAMFDMLSCGSWAGEVLEKDENLRRMVVIGPPQKSIDELPGEILGNPKLSFMSREKCEKIRDLGDFIKRETTDTVPLYLSIDKDVLSKSEVDTNWDQGSMSLDTLAFAIDEICKGRKLIGADICGLMPLSAENFSKDTNSIMQCKYSLYESDAALIEVLKKYV